MSIGRRTALAGEGPSSSVPAPRHRLTVVPLAARSQHLHRALERPHGHLPLRLLSRGTSLETAEKHYGDARVDAVHLGVGDQLPHPHAERDPVSGPAAGDHDARRAGEPIHRRSNVAYAE